MDQTLDHFKKQREKSEEKSEEHLRTEEVEQKTEKAYEPSTNFHKVFSQLIGKRQRTNTNQPKDSKMNDAPKEKDCHEEKEDVTESSNMGDEKKETAEQPAPVSAFQKLSNQATTENACHDEKEVTQSPSTENEKKETAEKSAPLSVFKKLSRQATTN